MRKRKLKKFVLPSLYAMTLSIIVICLGLVSHNLSGDTAYDYATNGIVNKVMPVFEEEIKAIVKPVDENISIKNKYYSKDDNQENQQESLILYNDTYMPSTGYTYTNNEVFNVYSVLDGTIKSIEKDDLLGNVITIDHGNNIVSVYYSVDNPEFQVNDFVNGGSLIAKSAKNDIYQDDYALVFEVSIDGKLVNPETFFQMNLEN